ncbi:hypothetical protein GGI20_000662 [Coemansia sp. BCRC 34301]|nr:hypothetical protein GGI20_000662 [Coemansia sp. BCRC 34301]
MKSVDTSQGHTLSATVAGAVAGARISETDLWLAWVDHTAKDDSLRQGLQSPSLRTLLRPMSCSLRRNSHQYVGQNEGSVTSLSPAAAQHAKLARRFAAQMLYGCAKGLVQQCAVPFCRNNSRFTARIKRLGRFAIDALSLELAQRACDSPGCEERMPHSESELGGLNRDELPNTQRASSKGKTRQSFVQTFTMAVQRFIGHGQPDAVTTDDDDVDEKGIRSTLCQSHRSAFGRKEAMATELEALSVNSSALQQPVALSPAAKLAVASAAALPVTNAVGSMPRMDPPWLPLPENLLLCDEASEPLIAVSQLDAQTAPLLSAIGGRLLCNTLSAILASPLRLAQCFLAAGSDTLPLGVDIEAAVTFFDSAKAEGTWTKEAAARHATALDAGVSSIERMMRRGGSSSDKSALARAAAILALYVVAQPPAAVADKVNSALMMRIACVIVGLAYPDVGNVKCDGPAMGWFSRYAQDSSMRQQWLVWWARVPALVVRRWVAVLHTDALESVERLISGMTSDRDIAAKLSNGDSSVRWVGALELLRLLDEANYQLCSYKLDFAERLAGFTKGSAGGDTIRTSEFCSTAILKLFDMDKELVRWMDNMRFRFGSGRAKRQMYNEWTEENLFSVFLYPFLFDLDDKTFLFVTEVHNRMAQRYLAAHGRQAELAYNYRMVNVDMYSEQHVRMDVSPEWPLMLSSRMQANRAGNPYLVLSVRRSSLVQDVIDTLLGDEGGMARVRFPLKVRFVDGGEDGVDMGGVQKEMFALLLPQLLAPECGLFVYTDDMKNESLWPNAESSHSLEDFEAFGALLGMAFANGILIDSTTVPLAPLLVSQLAVDRRSPSTTKMPLDALMACTATSFPTLTSGLQLLLDWDEAAQGSVEDVFCRSFEVTAAGVGTVPLIPNGEDICVTGANRQHYVRRYLEYISYEHVQAEISAVRRGFMQAADGIVFRMLRPHDLVEWLCTAGSQAIDVDELEQVTTYDDAYTADHMVVRRFWRVVRGMDQGQLRQLLQFVTASSRLPLGGCHNITFVVQRNGPDSDRLPTALTCFGRLLLPAYSTDEKMRRQLTTAIEYSREFGLV